MHIEIKNSQIVIEFSEEESSFIQQTVGNAESENIKNYIREKLVKALSLESLEKVTSAAVGKDFNLNKIKKVSAELKKSNFPSAKVPVSVSDDQLLGKDKFVSTNLVKGEESSGVAKSLYEDEEVLAQKSDSALDREVLAAQEQDEKQNEADAITAEVGDELLEDLLDKDLLKGRQKPKKSADAEQEEQKPNK